MTDIIYWNCQPVYLMTASSSSAVRNRGDVATDVSNSSDDGYVRVDYDYHWDHPSADDENQDEDPCCQIVGEVVEAASGEESLRNVFADSEKR